MTQHNHVKKIQAMIAAGQLTAEPGSMQHISVAHDDDCGIFSGGYCDCNPDIRLRWNQSAAQRN